MTFDGGMTLANTKVGYYNIFVAKISANGTWIWATAAGGSSDDFAMESLHWQMDRHW